MPCATTFSICAVDPASGGAGVGVASHCLAVGGLVPYAEPGVGAVATQAFVNPRYGPEGLELLRKGLAPQEVVRRLTEADVTVTGEDSEIEAMYRKEQLQKEGLDYYREPQHGRVLWFTRRIRQLAVVDRHGRGAVHSGARIFPWFGSRIGEGYTCQGNLLAGEPVLVRMAEAFETARASGGPMASWLMSALEAGEAAGGDARGKQAAGILVVADRGNWTGTDRACDLRVDDHPEPIRELRRILEKTGMA